MSRSSSTAVTTARRSHLGRHTDGDRVHRRRRRCQRRGLHGARRDRRGRNGVDRDPPGIEAGQSVVIADLDEPLPGTATDSSNADDTGTGGGFPGGGLPAAAVPRRRSPAVRRLTPEREPTPSSAEAPCVDVQRSTATSFPGTLRWLTANSQLRGEGGRNDRRKAADRRRRGQPAIHARRGPAAPRLRGDAWRPTDATRSTPWLRERPT